MSNFCKQSIGYLVYTRLKGAPVTDLKKSLSEFVVDRKVLRNLFYHQFQQIMSYRKRNYRDAYFTGLGYKEIVAIRWMDSDNLFDHQGRV